MNLGLILSPGDSLTKQKQSGQFDRLLNYYLAPYSSNFKKIYLFSYGDINFKTSLPNNIKVIPKPFFIPYQLYQFLIPLIHQKTIKSINIFRVFQVIGGIPALFIKKPFIVTYGYHYDRFASIEGSSLKAKLISWLVHPILIKAKKIIVTSKTNQLYLQNYQAKLKLIPNGVDPSVFKPTFNQSPFLILTVGRLTHQKNHLLLLKALNQSKFKAKIKLIIIGQGRLKNQLIKLAQKQGINLTIIPKQPHQSLNHIYQSASIFTLTSKIEGQPKALLEALSSGCACLTTNFEGNLVVNQQTGLIADNPKKLASKLDKLILDQKLRAKLSQNGRQLIIKKFNIKKLIQLEIKLLKSCSN